MITRCSYGILLGVLILGRQPTIRAEEGLTYRLNDQGICYLAYDGTVLFDRDQDLFFGCHHADFRRPDGTVYRQGGNHVTRDENVFTNRTDWGTIVTAVRQEDDSLLLDMAITNPSATDTLTEAELQFTHIGYEVPHAQCGSFNSGAFWAVDGLSDFVSYEFAGGGMPKLHVDYGSGCFSFGPEDPTTGDAWPSTLGRDHFGYFGGRMESIPPGETKARTFAFRFAPAGTDPYELARPDAERYEASRPLRLQWSDRRPIIQDTTFANGIDFHPANPCRYHTGADLRTEEGKKQFRTELMKRADGMIRVMQNTDAQGIVMWSIEGIEQKNIMYVGDPTRVRFWPEMEYVDETGVATVDAYLKRITDAGFRVGHCLRPQKLITVPLELGTVFQAEVPGTLTHLRVYSSGQEGRKPHRACLWRNRDKAVLAGPFEWVFGGEDGWVTLDIPDVPLEADTEYTVAVATSEEARYAFCHSQVARWNARGVPVDEAPEGTLAVAELATPRDRDDYFLARIRGYLVPPETGEYTFWIASDDGSEFSLSTDDQPENKQRIAWLEGWTGYGNWTAHPTQKSPPVHLEQGRRYYFEVLHAEGNGGDHAEVGWAKPGQATDGPSEIVPGSALRPLDGGPAGSTTYEYWTTVWCSNGGHLKFQDLGVSSEDRGQLPQATMPHAPLRDLVFVHGSQEETLFGPDPADEPWQNINHYDVADPAQHLIDLITYCKERWGSTLFYVDSCVFVNRPPVCSHRPLSLQRHGDPDCGCRILEPYTDVLSADAYRRILEAHPDVLVMPENQCTNVHPYAAPFDEGGHHGVRQTPRRVKTQWPGAFTTINISTDPQNVTADALDGYVEAVRQGDILMFQQWDYLQEAVQEVYRRAGQVPEVRIEAPAHGATFPAGRGVSIVATAADRDGRIAAVEFFRSNPVEGRVKLGITTAPPYAFTWQDPPAGRHVLSVKATDDAGLSIWAASVVVTVTGDERLRGR